ncbi:MAG: [FeFe] hydrogenase H-cluster radical SAM maturase HydG [Desulfobacterota bacterium]|nr:[FeFe] hydrogenase H-cluster radical SAM maturase HydG [Thermodesulfobacteriota bacterium]
MLFIDHGRICERIARHHAAPSPQQVRDILAKARELRGIDADEVLVLCRVVDNDLLEELFSTARFVKQQIYGNRLVLFAPLYVSNLCANECLYCAFRKSNTLVRRKALSQEEIARETEVLLHQGHKRILLVAGEAYPAEGISYIFRSIETIYKVTIPRARIRRINVNIAPLSVEEFRELHACKIGTYQLFQETYHEPTYRKLHPRGPKADYEYRLTAMDRAFTAGFDDVGIGILFGLYDWRYEVLALLSHIEHLEKTFGIGPHTISVPRLEPAEGAPLSMCPPFPVSDDAFKKIIAILRLAVPYTGIILSTRETPSMRRESLSLGVSQISAGSRTNPGGYSSTSSSEQFSLGDTRPLLEVIKDIVAQGYIPSFCTACYRLGRVGKDFMELAKPGLIKKHCLPNAIFTFAEYLEDFADNDLKNRGNTLIDTMITMDIDTDPLRSKVRENLQKIAAGERDLYF